MRSLLFAALLALGAACGEEKARLDPDTARLRDRIAELRPDVEAVLGARIPGPINVAVTTHDDLVPLLAAETEHRLARIEGGARGEELAQYARSEAESDAWGVMGSVDPGSGDMHICPDHFGNGAMFAIAGVDVEIPAPDWMTGPGFLDLVLIHELVHVYQMRSMDGAAFLGQPSALSSVLARGAVLEGHADYVTRLVAKRRGLEEVWQQYAEWREGADSDSATPGPGPSFAYVAGRKFMEAVVERLGYERAVQRLFENPPSLRAISMPGEYLDRADPPRGLDVVAQRLRVWLGESYPYADCGPVPLAVLREELGETAEVVGCIREAHGATAQEERFEIHPTATVRFIHTDGDAAAERLLQVLTAHVLDKIGAREDTTFRLDVLREGKVMVDEDAGWLLLGEFSLLKGSRHFAQRLLLRHGSFVLDVDLWDHPDDAEGALRLARRALAVIDPPAGKPSIDSGDWRARWHAIRNQGAGEDGLRRALDDRSAEVRRQAVLVLASRGVVDVPGKGRALEDPDWEVRWAVLRARMGRPDGVVAAFELALGDAHPAVIASACGYVRRQDLVDHIPWPLLARPLRHGRASVRRAAMDALAARGWRDGDRDTGEIVPVLAAAIEDDDPRVRSQAADFLGLLDADLPGLARLYDAALGHSDPWVRRQAAFALWQFDPILPETIPQLIQLLTDEAAGAQGVAATVLAKHGERAASALPALRRLLEHEDRDHRLDAAAAIRAIAGDAGPLTRIAREGLAASDARDRAWGAKAAGELGSDGAPYVGLLVEALRDSSAPLRCEAAKALGEVGRAAHEALGPLEELESDRSSHVRRAAKHARIRIRRESASGKDT